MSPALIRQIVPPAAGLVLVVALAGVTRHPQHASEPTSPPAAAPDPIGARTVGITVEPARAERADGALRTSGVTSLPTDATVKITPTVQGRVQQVLVKVGDSVRAGQTLALLNSVDAVHAINALNQAEGRVRLTARALDRQERLYRMGTPDVTAAVAALAQARQQQAFAALALRQQEEQARIGGFTDKPLEDARNAVASTRTSARQARADLDLALRERDRTESLHGLGIASARDVEAVRNVATKAQAGVEGAEESLQLAQETLARESRAFKTRLYANQQLETARNARRQADLSAAAAEKSLRLTRAQVLRDLLQARSDYHAAQLDREDARRVLSIHGIRDGRSSLVPIISPISGQIVERNVNPGQVVDTSTLTPWQMFTLANTSRIWVDADVYEPDLPRIRLGLPVRVTVASLPGRVLTGRVTYLNPSMNPSTHTFRVRTELANPGGALRSGMFASVSILAGSGPARLTVPVDAVQAEGEKRFVFVRRKPGKFEKRAVRIGSERRGRYPVISGLRAGEPVVTHGGLFLNSDAQSD